MPAAAGVAEKVGIEARVPDLIKNKLDGTITSEEPVTFVVLQELVRKVLATITEAERQKARLAA